MDMLTNTRIKIRRAILGAACCIIAALSGCGGGKTPQNTPWPSPSSNETPAVTAAPVTAEPTFTASPTLWPSPSAAISPSPTAKPSASPTVKPTASPTIKPTATPKPSPLTEQSVLSILGIRKEALIDLEYYDLDGDGIKDAIALYQNEPVSDTVSRLGVSAINSATKKHMDLSLPFDMVLQRPTIQLTVVPVTKSGKTTVYIIVGGQYGGTVSHVGYSVLKYTKSGLSDIFAKYRDNGMTYTLTMQDGPVAVLTLENGQKFRLKPTDLSTYKASGWIDENGKLTSSARVFDEHIGFSTLSFADEKGVLTLWGSQEIRGLHKLDVLATLDTIWRYDGTKWTVTADVTPVSSEVQG